MKKMTTIATTFLSIVFSASSYAQVTAEQALNLLKEGNKRFVEGKSIKPHQSKDRIK